MIIFDSGLPQISKMEFSVTITKDFLWLTFVAKLSILDICGSPGCSFQFCQVFNISFDKK